MINQKKRGYLQFLLLAILFVFSIPLVYSEELIITSDAPVFEKMGDYDAFISDSLTFEIGRPQIPFTKEHYYLDDDKKIEIIIEEGEYILYSNLTLYPLQEQERIIGGILTNNVFSYDLEFYETNVFTPGKFYDISEAYFRDTKFAYIRFFPYQYNPVNKELRHYPQLKINISYVSVKKENIRKDNQFKEINSILFKNYKESPITFDLTLGIQNQVKEEALKIYINKSGIHKLTYQDLDSAGFNLSYDPRMLKMTNKNEEIEIYIEGQDDGSFDINDFILFYADANKSEVFNQFSYTNAYWLEYSESNGARMETEQYDGGENITTYMSNIHYEFDNLWLTEYITKNEDPAFMTYINPGESSNHLNYTINISDPVGDGNISVYLYTHPSYNNSHNMTIKINNYTTGDYIWNSTLNWSESHFDIMRGNISGFMTNGNNTISVISNYFSVNPNFYLYYINYIDINYEKNFSNPALYVEFQGEPNRSVEITFNCSDMYVFNVDNLSIVRTSITDNTSQFNTTSAKYIALCKNDSITPNISMRSVNENNTGAEYLIICHSDFCNNSQQLAEFRNAEYTTRLTDVEDLYDLYTYGLIDDNAIKSYINYSYNNWATVPTYVVLVGDASINKKNSSLPTHYTELSDGYVYYVPSDNWFVSIVGDDRVPDMYIGRIPAKNQTQIEIAVDNIVGYNETNQGVWKRTLLFSADTESQFTVIMDLIISSIIPKQYDSEKIYLAEVSAALFRNLTKSTINNGTLITSYFGHGAIDRWGSSSFYISDLPNLTNENKMTYFMSVGCSLGTHDHPTTDSFSETFLFQPRKGAINVLTDGRISWNFFMYYYRDVYEYIFDQGITTVGDSYTLAKIDYVTAGDAYGLGERVTLLGDPATRLKLPADNISMSLPSTIAWNQSLNVSANISHGGNATFIIEKNYTLFFNISGTIYEGVINESFFMNQSIYEIGLNEFVIYAYNVTTGEDSLSIQNFTITEPNGVVNFTELTHDSAVIWETQANFTGYWNDRENDSVKMLICDLNGTSGLSCANTTYCESEFIAYNQNSPTSSTCNFTTPSSGDRQRFVYVYLCDAYQCAAPKETNFTLNYRPTLNGTIPSTTFSAYTEEYYINLSQYFSDDDGDELNYTLSSSYFTNATTNLTGSDLRIMLNSGATSSNGLITANDTYHTLNSNLFTITFNSIGPGGGGGSGGSGEASTTSLFSKQFISIIPGYNAIISTDSPENYGGITSINLDVNKKIDNVKMTVKETLSALPAFIPPIEEGAVYNYIEIITSNLGIRDVKTAKINFRVSKEWINEKGFIAEKVSLYRYSSSWKELKTQIITQDDSHISYSAITPGFSYFAIAESGKATEEGPEIVENETGPVLEVPKEISLETGGSFKINYFLILFILIIIGIIILDITLLLKYLHNRKLK